jgi:hypothetical protein
VIGGQQPVVGATIQLYAAGTPASGGSYGSGATALITGTLPTTDSNGGFTFTYNYPASPSFFYIVSSGGSPGYGNPENPHIVLMAAIGNCTPSTTLPVSFININEVTTAAAVMELQPFMASPTGSAGDPVIGAPAATYNDLRTAFENVSNLVSASTGAVVNPTGSKGQLLNTIADILAHCVNSDPGSDSFCSALFADATTSGDTAAADTTQAGWYIAKNQQNPPTNTYTSTLFNLISGTNPPFVALSSAPASFAVTAPTDLVACFAVLGGSAVTNTGSTVVSGGDLGIYPATGAAVTGFTFSAPTGPGIVTGAPATVHLTDSIAENAQNDLTAAYDYAQELPHTIDLTGQDLGSLGAPLTPGVYNFSAAAGLTGTLTLDAQNNPDAVFIFQIGTTLTTASSAKIVPINGARAQNVFWQIGTSATLGSSTQFVGAIMANASITVNSGTSIQGRTLASGATVTLDDNAVTAP